MKKKKMSPVLKVILIITGIAVVAALCYLAYRFLTPDYLEDFDEDFDDFDELEDAEEEPAAAEEAPAEEEAAEEKEEPVEE